MKRVLLTGMSGTGKSTLVRALSARGYKAVDTDSDEWCEWALPDGIAETINASEPDWIWREDRIRHLLSTEDTDVVFVSGCKSNQGRFYQHFNHIILLSAPVDVMLHRIHTRTDNPYGKTPDELARILEHLETVEPLLRRGATLEVNTDAPIDQIIQDILNHVLPSHRDNTGL